MTAVAAGHTFESDGGASDLTEHSAKPVVSQGAVITSRKWRHGYGEMLIETCEDVSVWVDGKPVPETLPNHRRPVPG